ncbi:MAG: DUF559 domain-containing protein [Spirochaetia bacterium]|nr:DUF559 domain-containing protein [Spirochaetia bacterium]
MKNKKTIEKMRKKKKGCLVWNKGLTKKEHPALLKISRRCEKRNPMHNKEVVERMKKSLKKYYKDESKEHRKNRIEKHKIYFFDNFERKKQISENVKKTIAKGKMWWQKDKKETIEIRRKISKKVKAWAKKNPEKILERTEKLKQFIIENPEKHPLRRVAGKNSYKQKQLYKILCNFISKKELVEELFIKTKNGYRFADIGWEKRKIDFEYDGKLWHNKKDDRKRDIELKEVGWKTIRFKYEDFLKNNFEKKILKVIEWNSKESNLSKRLE